MSWRTDAAFGLSVEPSRLRRTVFPMNCRIVDLMFAESVSASMGLFLLYLSDVGLCLQHKEMSENLMGTIPDGHGGSCRLRIQLSQGITHPDGA